MALALLPAAAAIADTSPATESAAKAPSTSEFMPMKVEGFDAATAAANGFKIVTNSDGSQSSVPVTASAVAMRQAALSARSAAQMSGAVVTPDGDSRGDCGGADITAVKKANNDLVWESWFQVFGAATGYSWNVTAIGALSTNSWHMSGNGPASGYKHFSGGGTVRGPGYANVPIWSVVTLADGSVCYSLDPIAWFG